MHCTQCTAHLHDIRMATKCVRIAWMRYLCLISNLFRVIGSFCGSNFNHIYWNYGLHILQSVWVEYRTIQKNRVRPKYLQINWNFGYHNLSNFRFRKYMKSKETSILNFSFELFSIFNIHFADNQINEETESDRSHWNLSLVCDLNRKQLSLLTSMIDGNMQFKMGLTTEAFMQ